MALVKKIRADWAPSENPSLAVGEVIQITDFRSLVQSGVAVLVDENGNELSLPGTVFNCPICYAQTTTLLGFTNHVDTHKSPVAEKPASALEEATVEAAQAKTEETTTVKEPTEPETSVSAEETTTEVPVKEPEEKVETVKGGKK